MLLALLADIHANGPALEAVLLRTKTLGVDKLIFLGDLVGYGPDPVSVLKIVRHEVAQGAIAIQGNHDEAAITGTGQMNHAAADAIAWTHTQLDADDKAFLAALPLAHTQNELLFVHASAAQPAKWTYVTNRETASASMAAAAQRITFCGHVHVPALYYLTAAGGAVDHKPATNIAIPLSGSRKWLAVCGSVGQPRDGNAASSFSTYDTTTQHLTYQRVAYDVEHVARRIRDAGLPESLAARLMKGH